MPPTPSVGGPNLPPISNDAIVDSRGFLTPLGLNLFQQLWAGVFGTGGIAGQVPQAGDMKVVGGAGAQAGWLRCDNAAYLQSTYPDLFLAIGTTWGAAGAGTFRVPGMKGVFPIGADASHLLGANGGALSRLIAKANLPNYILPNTLSWTQDTGTSDKLGAAGGAPTAVQAAGAVNVFPSSNFGAQAITVTGHISGNVTLDGSGTALDTTPAYSAVNWLIKY